MFNVVFLARHCSFPLCFKAHYVFVSSYKILKQDTIFHKIMLTNDYLTVEKLLGDRIVHNIIFRCLTLLKLENKLSKCKNTTRWAARVSNNIPLYKLKTTVLGLYYMY